MDFNGLSKFFSCGYFCRRKVKVFAAQPFKICRSNLCSAHRRLRFDDAYQFAYPIANRSNLQVSQLGFRSLATPPATGGRAAKPNPLAIRSPNVYRFRPVTSHGVASAPVLNSMESPRRLLAFWVLRRRRLADLRFLNAAEAQLVASAISYLENAEATNCSNFLLLQQTLPAIMCKPRNFNQQSLQSCVQLAAFVVHLQFAHIRLEAASWQSSHCLAAAAYTSMWFPGSALSITRCFALCWFVFWTRVLGGGATSLRLKGHHPLQPSSRFYLHFAFSASPESLNKSSILCCASRFYFCQWFFQISSGLVKAIPSEVSSSLCFGWFTGSALSAMVWNQMLYLLASKSLKLQEHSRVFQLLHHMPSFVL